MIVPVQKQKLLLISVPSQAATELQGVMMGCVDSMKENWNTVMCSETKNTNRMFSRIIRAKMQTYLFSSFTRALTEAPLTSTTSKITIMSYRDKICKKTDLT